MYEWISSWPVWELLRLSGVISYLLLVLGICLGITHSLPLWRGRTKAAMYTWHQTTVNAGTLIGLLHGVLPVISTYMPFGWSEVLVPFAAKDHRVMNGIGTIAAYVLLLVIFTTDIRSRLGRKLWRLTHLLSYPMFILVWIHGYFIGTDTSMLAMRWMYLLTMALVVGLTVVRVLAPRPQPQARTANQLPVVR